MTVKKTDKYVEVAPAIPLKSGQSQVYTYKISENSDVRPKKNSKIKIPFGPRWVNGTIVRTHNQRVHYPTKEVKILDTPQLTVEQFKFAEWIASTMHGGLGYTLRLFYPSSNKKTVIKSVKKAIKKNNQKTVILEKDLLTRIKKIAENIKKDQQVLILVPELWLLEGWIENISKYTKQEVIAVHGGLSSGAYNEIWHKTRAGSPLIIIGTQKSLYLPFSYLQTIVIDESFISTHKLWDAYPRLDNRYAVEELQRIHNCNLIYSASFPSLQTYQQIQDKELKIKLNNPLQLKAEVIPISFNDREKKRLLPDQFIWQLRQWLKRKQTIFILYNRKGSWRVMSCAKCRQVVRCSSCEMAMSVSERKDKLICHNCDKEKKISEKCSACGHEKFSYIGAGTEKVISIFKKTFPRQNIVNLNAQTVKTISINRLKDTVSSGIVIGTTASFRFLSHLKIDHTVFLFPEQTFLFPDFRSEEKAIYLLARLSQLTSSRKPILLVTRQKYSTEEKLSRPINKLYADILRERRRLKYPPYNDIVRMTVSDKTSEKAFKKAVDVRKKIATDDILIRGPFQGFAKKQKGKYEAHLLFIGKVKEITKLSKKISVDNADLAPERIL